MCRIFEGGSVSHLGVELRKGLHADRLEDGSLSLCYHGSGNLRVPDWEVTLSVVEYGNLPIPVFDSAPQARIPETVTATVVPFKVIPGVFVPKKAKPPVRAKPVVSKPKAPVKKKGKK